MNARQRREGEEPAAQAPISEQVEERDRPIEPPTCATRPEEFLLAVQRSAGNVATQRLIGAAGRSALRTPSRALARYEAGEHAQFAADHRAIRLPNGVELTEADIIALGDFYEDPTALYDAKPDELLLMIGLIRRDRRAFEASPTEAAGSESVASQRAKGVPPEERVGQVENVEWQEATLGRPEGKRFLDQTGRGDVHFAPSADRGSGGGDNRSEWERLHRQALEIAARSAPASQVPDAALLVNGFAAHFLTDAFSGGHLIAKYDVIAEVKKRWSRLRERTFAEGVARRVLADPGAEQKLAGYVLPGNFEITEGKFALLMLYVAERKQDELLNGFARVVHNKLNESVSVAQGPTLEGTAGYAVGIEVENDLGERWVISGDTTLSRSPTSLEIGRRAVAMANENVALAARAGRNLPYEELVERVWAHVPRPTAAGAALVDEIVKKYTDPTSSPAMDAYAEVIIDEMDLVLPELERDGKLRKAKDRTPGKEARTGPGGPGESAQ